MTEDKLNVICKFCKNSTTGTWIFDSELNTYAHIECIKKALEEYIPTEDHFVHPEAISMIHHLNKEEYAKWHKQELIGNKIRLDRISSLRELLYSEDLTEEQIQIVVRGYEIGYQKALNRISEFTVSEKSVTPSNSASIRKLMGIS